jgi:hypothetical protein
VWRDSEVLSPLSGWKETCWFEDEEAVFLELEIQLDGAVRIQRQMALDCQRRFLFLADAVLGQKPAALEYSGRLPLNPGVSATGSKETTELLLTGRGRLATVLPLALPEWRRGCRTDRLTPTRGALELRQRGHGKSMYCPLAFDLDPRRMSRPLTWRQLTVAESLVVQPADVAVGYRVQRGRDQWLVYQSLGERANRTLLGHNLAGETLIARFDKSGEVEPLVEVE